MNSSQTLAEQAMVVIMAAGKGTRMGRGDLAKVCFEIDGVPTICRLIEGFKKQRFRRFLLVVGNKTDQVLQTVGREHSDALYVFQPQQLGTGHAAKVAAAALQNMDFHGPVLVTAGDSVIESAAIEALVSGYVKQQADFALLAPPVRRANAASVGRIFVDESGQALEILERADWARAAVAEALLEQFDRGDTLTRQDVSDVLDRYLPDPRKREKPLAELLEALGAGAEGDGPPDSDEPLDREVQERVRAVLQSERYQLRIAGKALSPRQVDRVSKYANASLYLFSSEVFYEGVAMIDNHNAQGEYYITDLVRLLSGIRDRQGEPRYRVRAIPIESPDWIQGFNSPDELLAIQDYLRRRKLREEKAAAAAGRPRLKPSQYATVHQWLAKIEDGRPSLRRWLERIYGPVERCHQEKLRDLKAVLECYAAAFGADQKVCIVRAPGRINLMGRHIDHRGGRTNFLAIDREIVAVAGLRDDDEVVAVNTEPKEFPRVEFKIAELIGRFAWSDWLNFVNSDWVRKMVRATGDWGNYLKAAVVRLQHRYQDAMVRGMNLAVTGNVPIAAGLSSSSTIVVAALQAAIALNNFALTSQQFIDLCGEGEWFVGSRGGAGDHAAIYLGQRGRIAHVGYLPFRVEKILEAPQDYQVLVANSHVQAKKSGTARDTFNEKIASYNLGLALLKQRCPEIRGTVEYVRDLNPAKIGCNTSDIYRMLLKVPQTMTRRDFETMLSKEHRELMETNFATHAEPRFYNPRGVLLFGAAETARSLLCVELLESGRVETFGQWMKISHDGDRVCRRDAQGQYQPMVRDAEDQYFHQLIADLGSEDPNRVLRAQLYMQPGSYACSTPEIDQMVDIACGVPGVAGAQIAGAGLGGCIMVLARTESIESVRSTLVKQYYRPAGLRPAVYPCIAVEGAGLVDF